MGNDRVNDHPKTWEVLSILVIHGFVSRDFCDDRHGITLAVLHFDILHMHSLKPAIHLFSPAP